MSLVPISVEFLYEGLMVDYPIYFKDGKQLVLLCKNLILTKNRLTAIKSALDAGRNIYVDEERRAALLEDTSFFKVAQERLEAKLGMTQVKERVKKIISSAEESGIVKREEIDEMVGSLTEKIDESDAATIIQCISGMREVDEYLFSHSVNVAMLNGLIGRWLHMSEDDCRELVKAGAVHDIGKVRISPKIINKPGKLTPLEYEAVKMHTLFGREILEESGETSREILDAAELHHEKVNGTGYPHGYMGGQISRFASITAVSDIYDAMVARRCYKSESSPFEILDQISKNAFSGLDMGIIKAFLQNMPGELTGTNVLLSNGASARVKYVNPNQYRFPVVELDGETVQTNENLKCVRIYTA
ncbi:MAG: HD-GYP domain-containing protein [Oscillospiraceae bacterium]|nr:HD-GYP domain-containing protein [Oscillospiraceae bacterium]